MEGQNIKKSKLDYSKQILKKVSFDDALFERELLKALRQLSQKDATQLRSWCQEKFDKHSIKEIIKYNNQKIYKDEN